MRPAYARHPYAVAFHTLGLALLMLVYTRWQVPPAWSIPAYLVLALYLAGALESTGGTA